MSKLTIDRFEGDKAVCQKDGGDMTDVPRSSLPAGAKEGDCLSFDESAYELDPGEAARRAARIASKAANVFKD